MSTASKIPSGLQFNGHRHRESDALSKYYTILRNRYKILLPLVCSTSFKLSIMIQRSMYFKRKWQSFTIPNRMIVRHAYHSWEMKWFENGDSAAREQNIQFENDYNLLSSVLSSYGTLQEAAIMEPLRPVARLFIAVQKLESCPSIIHMLPKVRSSSATFRAIVKDTDIHKLNSRLISIKDLFRNERSLPTAVDPVQTPQILISQALPFYRIGQHLGHSYYKHSRRNPYLNHHLLYIGWI